MGLCSQPWCLTAKCVLIFMLIVHCPDESVNVFNISRKRLIENSAAAYFARPKSH